MATRDDDLETMQELKAIANVAFVETCKLEVTRFDSDDPDSL